MTSPDVNLLAPSAQPALELIALAQLPPEEARLKLRALLLANPNHFGNVPLSSLNAVLNIQQDTSYESISRVGCDTQLKRLHATLNLWQSKGYSNNHFSNSSREYIRFYLCQDGGAKWLDQGLCSMSVFDSQRTGCLSLEVTSPVACELQLRSAAPPLRIRAILSWNVPPPAGAPAWVPNWGNVLESVIALDDAQSDRLRAAPAIIGPGIREAVHIQQVRHWLLSAKFDPDHSFLAYVFAKAAGSDRSGVRASQCRAKLDSPQAGLLPSLSPAIFQRHQKAFDL